jgi:hypothetical protein
MKDEILSPSSTRLNLLRQSITNLLATEALITFGLLSAVAFLSYALLMPQLGFYKEDWYLIWAAKTNGAQAIIPTFLVDRPGAGFVYPIFYPLLGDSPIGWHLMAFALRLAGGFLVFGTLRRVWPQARIGATAAALLFIVYPGYLQQYNAVNKAFWLVSLTAALLSLYLTVVSLRSGNKGMALLSGATAVVLAGIYPTIIEFYVGLEAVRLALIWVLVAERQPGNWKQTLKGAMLRFLPYLLVAGSFLVWRVFFFESTRPTTNLGRLFGDYLSMPVHMLGRLVSETFKDFFETVFLAWVVPFNNRLYPAELQDLAVGGLVGLLGAGLTAAVFLWLQKRGKWEDEQSSVYRSWLWLGAFATLVTIFPHIAAGRDINFDRVARADHYTIQASLGAVILLVALLVYNLSGKARIAVISLLVGASIFTHYQQSALMRDNWEIQRQAWWQLSWRAPALKQNTLLFVGLPSGFALQEGYEIWGPANLIYAPQSDKVLIGGEVIDTSFVYDLIIGAGKYRDMRTIKVPRNFAAPLVANLPTPRTCLKVYDGAKTELGEYESPLVRLYAPYSNINQIEIDLPFASPSEEIFGPEPEHNWCYYYQKASYARQIGDWQEVVRLADEARLKGLNPRDHIEWMPFFEGYASVGRDKEARNLAVILKSVSGPSSLICKQLESQPRIYPGDYDVEKVLDLLCGTRE